MTERPAGGPSGPSSRGGPLWVLPPLFLIVALLLIYGRAPLKRHVSPPPDVRQREETVAAFRGEALALDGSTLHVRLAPLHADPERAAFDGRALEAQLALERGTPWRLSLRWTPAPEAPREEPRTDVPKAPPAGLTLDGLSITDAEGCALVPIAPIAPGESGSTAPIDPLRTLLAPPSAALLPGQGLDLLLWGRGPAEGAQLVGLVQQGTDTAPWCAQVALKPHPMRRDELEGPLARFDRDVAPAGKSLEIPASEGALPVRPGPGRY